MLTAFFSDAVALDRMKGGQSPVKHGKINLSEARMILGFLSPTCHHSTLWGSCMDKAVSSETHLADMMATRKRVLMDR